MHFVFDSMSSVAVRRCDSQAMSRKAGNSPRRGATVASSCSTSKPGFYPQRSPHSTRQSLSRSYDSPEEIHRLSQVSTKKSGSPVLRRSASPPAPSAVRKHNNASSGRNQTVLDDAAWMTDRIQSLQKTGIFRYPSMSKLRNSAHVSSSGQYVCASTIEDYENMSCFSSSPIQSSNSLQNQTASTFTDEPLSAFRLSEVTLGDEDLLTDFSSTCNSTPVSLQSDHVFDRTAADYHQGTSCLHNVERIHSDTPHQDLKASSKNSLLNMGGDLLYRLEALQHRAELAEKASLPNKIGFNQVHQCSKDPWHGQVLLWNQGSLSTIDSQNVITQQSSVLSAAVSPTHSTFESPSWQREGPDKSSDSTFWLHKEVETQPYVSHLMYSSSRIIRPEYYLPLSKEEEPALKDVAGCLSSSSNERKLASKDEQLKRSTLRRSSALCQFRSEDVRPGKCLSSHKQIHPTRKSRRSLERSMDSVYRSVPARGVTLFSLSEPCLTAAREACSTKSKSAQSSSCTGNDNYTNLIQEDKSLDLSTEEDGHIQNKLGIEADYDGEVSWISEENVESFLRSRCLINDHVDVMHAPPEFSDSNGDSTTNATVSLFAGKDHTQSKDKKLHSYEQSLSSPSGSRNGISQVNLAEHITENMEESSMFDKCLKNFHVSEDSLTINSQISSQFCHTEEGQLLDTDSLVCCKTIPDNKQTNGSQEVSRTMEQSYIEEKHASCSVLCCKGSDKGASEAQSATLETQQQMQITKLARPFCLKRSRVDNSTTLITDEFSSLNTLLSSPEIHPMENQHWPVHVKMCEKGLPSQGLSERVILPSNSEHKNFTKIARSLSFHDKGVSELEASSNHSTCDDLSELKSTSFSHYWIRNSAYSLDLAELLSSVTRGYREPDAANFGKILQDLKPQETSGSMEQVPGISDMDKEHGKSCMTASETVTGEVLATGSKPSQQCRQLQLMDNSAGTGTLYRLQDDSRVDKVVKDEDCWQQLVVPKEVPKDAENLEILDKVLQETLSKGKDVGTRVLSSHTCEPKQVECEKYEELTYPEQHVSKASTSYHSNLLFLEDTTKDSGKLDIPCSPCLQDSETLLSEQLMKIPSILSVYKNPLWLDESSTDFENHHNLQDEEFLDFTHCSERSIGFPDSDKNRLSFSERFENKTWDTYEGMCAFISPPDYPYGTDREKVSEAKDKFLSFVGCSDVDSLWDAQSQIKKKLRNSSTEVENGNDSVCKSQVLESHLASKDLISCNLSGFEAKEKVTASDQADQHQLLGSYSKPDLTSQILLSSSSVKVLSIADDNCKSLCLSSAPFLCSEQCLQLTNTSTTNTNVSSHGAKPSVSLVNCLSEQVLWPGSTSLISKNATIQDVALLACKTRKRELLNTAPSTDITDETVNHDRKEDRSRQEPFASIEARSASSISDVEHLHPPDSELSSVNATNKIQSSKHPTILSNGEMQAKEEVKRVTFVYPSSNEPLHKNAALPDVPLDSSSTGVLPLFSSATKGHGNLKTKEQKQPLKQEKSQDVQTDLNRLGEKVESLEEEIDKFKRQNKILQNLVKCMIRKTKQLQQGFRFKKTRGTSRGFMTCLCLVRVQRRRSKTMRKL